MQEERAGGPQESPADRPRRDGRRRLARAALLAAAEELMAAGAAPSVQEAADRAGVARATAYRIFSSAEQLHAEAALNRIAAEATALAAAEAEAAPAADAGEAAARLVARVLAMVRANERAFRSLLRLSLEPPARRGGRRLDWIRAALAPHEAALAPGAVERLVPALALLTGIETLVVLCDVCCEDRDAAAAVAERIARALAAAEAAG